MGCSSCSNNESGAPAGCKSNGNCGTYGCNKLDVFDWLSGLEPKIGGKAFDVIEVRFKDDRKGFYRASNNLEVYVGDVVAVEAANGYDVGIVSLTGELTRFQMRKKKVKDNHETKKILRKATDEDIKKWQEGRKLEWDYMLNSRKIAIELGLTMKISNVEMQGDLSKATFYYTAEGRVDFRELIKRFAAKFKVKVDMRQIGTRQEAGKVGGIGSCGRELCCSTWLTDFRSVSTGSARYQQLSLNPAKLAGQCGKLKCCLNFELDQYIDAVKDFPSNNTKLKTAKGIAYHFKTDIFKRIMYFVYGGDKVTPPVGLTLENVWKVIEMNKKGETPESLFDFELELVVEEKPEYLNVVGQDSLTRFDQKKRRKKKRKPRGGGNRSNNQNGKRPSGNTNKKPSNNKKKGQGNSNSNNKSGGNSKRSNNQNKKQSNRRNSNKKRPSNTNKGQQNQKKSSENQRNQKQKPNSNNKQ